MRPAAKKSHPSRPFVPPPPEAVRKVSAAALSAVNVAMLATGEAVTALWEEAAVAPAPSWLSEKKVRAPMVVDPSYQLAAISIPNFSDVVSSLRDRFRSDDAPPARTVPAVELTGSSDRAPEVVPPVATTPAAPRAPASSPTLLQRVIERISVPSLPSVNSSGTLSSSSGSSAALNARFQELENSLKSEIYRATAQSSVSQTPFLQAVSLASRIDQLSNVTITGSTFSGTSIIGTAATLDSAAVSGLVSAATLAISGTASTSGLVISSVGSGSTQCLQVDGTGAVSGTGSACGSGGGGGGSSGGTDFVFFNNSGTRQTTTTNQVLLGASATTSLAKLEVIGNSVVIGNIGVGTTSPYAPLSVVGQVVGSFFTATTTTNSTFPNLISTNATATSLYIGTLNGPLQANAGQVSATTSITHLYGGTGLTATPTFGQILRGTGSGYALVATSTLGIALADTTGTLAATRGGTGLSTITLNQLLVGGAGNTVTQIATSSLGLLTTNVAEGVNLYYLDTRVQSFVHASTTIPKTYTSNTFTGLNIFGNASSSLFSILDTFYVGRTATSTIQGSTSGTSTLQGFLNVLGTNSTSTFSGDVFSRGIAALNRLYVGTTATSSIQGTTSGTSTLQGFLSVLGTNSTSTFSGHLSTLGNILAGEFMLADTGGNGTFWTMEELSNNDFQLSYPTRRNIIFNAGNVGLATTTPNWSLQVASATPYVALTDTDAPTNQKHWLLSALDGIFRIGTSSDALTGTSTYLTVNGSTGGQVGIGSSTPSSLLSVSGSAYLGSSAANILTIHTGIVNHPISSTTTIPNGADNVWSIATSSANVPLLSVSTRSSLNGLLGFGSSSPWGKFSMEIGPLNPTFVVANQGSSTPSFIISGVNNNGAVGVATNTPSANFVFSSNGSTYLGAGTASTLTVHAGTINYPVASTSTVPNVANAWTIASSTAANANSIFNLSLSTTGATSTLGFFVSTTTGLTSGVGLGLPSALQNYVIVGNGKQQAGIGIINGGLCVDQDGWCSATTTGRISASRDITTGGTDLAEMYTSVSVLEPGDIVQTVGGVSVERAATEGRHIIGVVSTAPGAILGFGPNEIEMAGGKYPIALAGRVPVKVMLEGGDINPGDRIALSSMTGVGMRATSSSFTIGIALDRFNPLSVKDGNGVGKVLVFVNLGYIPLDTGLAGVAQGTTNAWSVDQSSGRVDVNFFGNINLQGNALIDVSRIAGYQNKWSIDASGRLTADEVRANKLCLGTVCIDETNLRALLIHGGLLAPESSSTSSTTPPMLPSDPPPATTTPSEEFSPPPPPSEPATTTATTTP